MASVTFHAVCPPSNKRKDGTIPVKIRVTFKGRHRYLNTTLIARNGDLTRGGVIKSPDILRKAADLIVQMQDTLESVSPFMLAGWDVDLVVLHILGSISEQSFRLDFFQFGEDYITAKTPTTRRAYTMALSALERFIGKRELDINAITRSLLLDFVTFIAAEPKMHYDPRSGEYVRTGERKGVGAASRHLMKLQHIFNAAKLKYNDDDRVLIPRDPFAGIPRNYGEPDGAKPLPLEVMQRLVLDDQARGVERVALDAFILSFATMGANLADLYAAPKFSGDEWRYFRKKITSRKAEMHVTIQPEVLTICKRLEGRGPYWLNVLHRIAGRAENVTPKVNAGLKRWAARAGVEPFTFYAARKSWATYARNLCHIEKATIDEALAHKGDYSLADIYIEKSWDHLNEANRKVLGLLRWNRVIVPEKEQQIHQTED